MTFLILAAVATALTSLALIAAGRPEPRRLPVRVRDHDPRRPPR